MDQHGKDTIITYTTVRGHHLNYLMLFKKYKKKLDIINMKYFLISLHFGASYRSKVMTASQPCFQPWLAGLSHPSITFKHLSIHACWIGLAGGRWHTMNKPTIIKWTSVHHENTVHKTQNMHKHFDASTALLVPMSYVRLLDCSKSGFPDPYRFAQSESILMGRDIM